MSTDSLAIRLASLRRKGDEEDFEGEGEVSPYGPLNGSTIASYSTSITKGLVVKKFRAGDAMVLLGLEGHPPLLVTRPPRNPGKI